MAPSIVDTPPAPVQPSKQSAPHPYAPLSADEITNANNLIRAQWPQGTDLWFKTITLAEPPKAETVPFLDAEHAGRTATPPPRKAWVNYYISMTSKFHEAIVNLTEQSVERNVRLGANMHGPADGAEIIAMEEICLKDEGVQKELAKLQLPKGTVVVVDPWIYGSDGVNDDERMWQCFMYVRDLANPDEADSNHYALPLAISPVISAEHRKVIRIDVLPTGADATVKPLEPFRARPANEYIPERQTLRGGVKPLHVVQPEGASFTVTEEGTSNVVAWQKWRFRVGFNAREGMVLYDVRYDDRSLFHRLSLSDMSIPYADPRHPFHKKAAFDLGDAGAGVMANNLRLGCDCLGAIHYLSGVLADDRGAPLPMPNVMCLHEQDGGILWKHTNYRTGRAALVRNRELVLQTILTVANYEYILAFVFNQAAELHYEVRATGILSTQPIDDGVDVPWGTRVHPGVLAAHHQHIFSLRIDPSLDGPLNRVSYTETHALPRDAALNPHGVGYATRDTLVRTSSGLDAAPEHGRTFKIANALAPANPVNGAAPAYKIHLPASQPLLADRGSFHRARAEFADRALYVTRYRDGELYAGGQYTNQSRGGTGVRAWAERGDDVVDQDVVVFAQFGLNHVPRIEDFPVMPAEVLRVSLKPVNFFERNPAMDVPPSTQAFNKSELISSQQRRGGAEAAVVDGNGAACCSNGGTNGSANGHGNGNGHA